MFFFHNFNFFFYGQRRALQLLSIEQYVGFTIHIKYGGEIRNIAKNVSFAVKLKNFYIERGKYTELIKKLKFQ